MEQPTGTVILKQGREKPFLNKHPWIFSGSIDHVEAQPGEIVTIRDRAGSFLARGYYNPHSQINVRILTWDEADTLDEVWWRARLQQAIEARSMLAIREGLSAYRLIHAESDGLPGLIVDRYGDVLVLQSLTLGIERIKPLLVSLLADLLHPVAIIERSDADARQKEGMPDLTAVLWGQPPAMPLVIEEYGLRYPVDIFTGHKTGFYLDQRDSRHRLLTSKLVEDKEVLNAFSYSGAFGLCAARAGARLVVNLDSSAQALELAEQAAGLNNLENAAIEYVTANVFSQLRAYRAEGRLFDIIILDPPKFAHSTREIERAARGYKDINLLAFQTLRPGGVLITFSCSGVIDADLFQKIVFSASTDARRQAQIIGWLGQPEDHPVLLSFPEGRYLKGLICRIRPL